MTNALLPQVFVENNIFECLEDWDSEDCVLASHNKKIQISGGKKLDILEFYINFYDNNLISAPEYE